MATYQKKPVVIEAKQWFEKDYGKFSSTDIRNKVVKEVSNFIILTLDGYHHVSDGDWIIKGGSWEFYSCNPDIFKRTYEEVR